ncbi:hypothetical protein UC34_08935 [Pandoraea vervacti]|uniref:Uncharacterized protein n=1 Tax=Pandoraea vervacti TaxID=656178 RepID=A0ABN4FNA5_9BURK|nr:hypothetical protein UC34_08935 [Pandoraea vervacti]
MSSDGDVTSVAAIELSDFLRECAGADWRDALIGGEPGRDALTRRRQACLRAGSTEANGANGATGEFGATEADAVTGMTGTTDEASSGGNEWPDAACAQAARRVRSTSL